MSRSQINLDVVLPLAPKSFCSYEVDACFNKSTVDMKTSNFETSPRLVTLIL
jgi:hypothetical protein